MHMNEQLRVKTEVDPLAADCFVVGLSFLTCESAHCRSHGIHNQTIKVKLQV